MRSVGQAAFHRRRAEPFAECRILVAYRLDPAYLAKPAPGEFALLDLAESKKTFYAIPRWLTAAALRLRIEEGFSPSERVGEFEWIL